MPRNPIATPDRSLPAALRRRFASVDDRMDGARRERAKELKALARQYRTDFRALLGTDGVRKYNALRKRLAGASRSVRRRETAAFLCSIGFDRLKANKLRDAHAESLRMLFDDGSLSGPIRDRLPPRCSPWVDYTPPFAGELFVPRVQKQGDVNDPVVTPYLNRLTGELGSRVQAGVDGAGDDDGLDADYYTAFRTFHTTLASGSLEVSLDFEIVAEELRGEVDDEWGWSQSQVRQTGAAGIRVMTVTQPDTGSWSTIINHMQSTWGDDITWLKGGNPGDGHSYRFRTQTSYPQGTIIILEAGIRSYAWFQANDMSVDMTADIHLKLERMRVRSCP